MRRFQPFSVRAHAKVNLSLRVLDARPDGYHDLETVFQALALHDTLDVEPHKGRLELSCDMPGVPLDENNLAWRAATLVWRCSGRSGEPGGVRLHLRKRIPAQGGLGGGSSNAAAALVGLAGLWLPGADLAILHDLGASIGADVPFFLCGGTALGLHRGNRVFPLADLPAWHVVLVFPPFGVSTPAAYGWLDEAREAGGISPGGYGQLQLAGGVAIDVRNDLEMPVVRRHPQIGQLRNALVALGAEGAAMSGSGSTVFGLYSSRDRAASAAAALRREGWQTLVTRTASRRQSSLPGPLVVRTRFSRID